MKVHSPFAMSFLLACLAAPGFAGAQTVLDYFVSRETMTTGGVNTVQAGAPAFCSPSYQPVVVDSACMAPGAYGCTTPDAYGTCAAPQACRPRCDVACQVCDSAPVCAAPAPVRSCRPSDTSSSTCGCGCQRSGCQCGNQGGKSDGCCGKCGCCSEWKRAHTTGDLFPHFPYLPEHGGYYYFRPYNWHHVHEHVARAHQWNLNPANPYSVAMFDRIYEDFAMRFPSGQVEIPQPPRSRDAGLPDLESLLRSAP